MVSRLGFVSHNSSSLTFSHSPGPEFWTNDFVLDDVPLAFNVCFSISRIVVLRSVFSLGDVLAFDNGISFSSGTSVLRNGFLLDDVQALKISFSLIYSVNLNICRFIIVLFFNTKCNCLKIDHRETLNENPSLNITTQIETRHLIHIIKCIAYKYPNMYLML